MQLLLVKLVAVTHQSGHTQHLEAINTGHKSTRKPIKIGKKIQFDRLATLNQPDRI